jgi:hypothetical protein
LGYVLIPWIYLLASDVPAVAQAGADGGLRSCKTIEEG